MANSQILSKPCADMLVVSVTMTVSLAPVLRPRNIAMMDDHQADGPLPCHDSEN